MIEQKVEVEQMKFTKMHGLGNDYVYVNCLQETVECPSKLAVRLSDRHFGVGSDGLILIRPSKAADFEMEMYNADGSRGEMCGNGIRCVGKYVYDKGLTNKTQLSIETLAGIKRLDLSVENGRVKFVRVDMGQPEFAAERIPVISDREEAVCMPLTVGDAEYKVTCVSMGNPHCVVFQEEDVRKLALHEIGPAFERHEAFPSRINTEFVNVLDQKTLRMRVYERGSGETLACGTGACAVAVAAMRNGLCDAAATVLLTGGALEIEWKGPGSPVYMTGAAETVFEGEIE